jgi:hypothetical protein
MGPLRLSTEAWRLLLEIGRPSWSSSRPNFALQENMFSFNFCKKNLGIV